MGVFNSKEARLKHKKRAPQPSNTASCTGKSSYYSVTCPAGTLTLTWTGCFDWNPCQAAATSVPLEYKKRAPQPACPSGYSFYNTTCNDTGYFEGCFNEAPCDHRDNDDSLSVVQTLGAPELTINLFPAAATSSAAAATSTQTSTKTSPAQTKIVSSSSSNHLHSSSNLPTSSSQTSSTAFSSQSSPTTSSTSARTASPVPVVSSAPAGTARLSSSSHSNTTAVAAGTVGAIVGAIIALILMLLILRWRKRRTEGKIRVTRHDNDPRLQKIDANGAGSAFQDKNGNESAPAYKHADRNSLLYPGTNNAGNDGHAAYNRSDPYSAASSLSPIQPGPEMPGSTPDPTGKRPELEVPAFHIPIELSPNAERSSINTPRKAPSPSRVNSSGQGGLRQTADGSLMHPNLDLTGEEAGGRGAKKTGGSHVMSWMSYDGDGAGPIL